jgi:hypothetical protein
MGLVLSVDSNVGMLLTTHAHLLLTPHVHPLRHEIDGE